MATDTEKRISSVIKKRGSKALWGIFGIRNARAKKIIAFVDGSVGKIMEKGKLWKLADILKVLEKEDIVKNDSELAFAFFIFGCWYGKETFIQDAQKRLVGFKQMMPKATNGEMYKN